MLETEAENVRSSIVNAMQHIRSFMEEVMDTARKLGTVIQQIEGTTQLNTSTYDGTTSIHVVSDKTSVFTRLVTKYTKMPIVRIFRLQKSASKSFSKGLVRMLVKKGG